MDPNVEIGPRNIVEINKAKQDIVSRVDQIDQDPGLTPADKAQEKSILGQRILDNLTQVTNDAEKARQTTIAAGGQLRASDRTEAQGVKTAIVQYFEGINQAIITPPTQSLEILLEVEQKLSGGFINDNTAGFLHPIIFELANSQLTIDQLEVLFKDLNDKIPAIQVNLAINIREAFLDLAQQGRLGITRAEAERRFRLKKMRLDADDIKGLSESQKDSLSNYKDRLTIFVDNHYPADQRSEASKTIIDLIITRDRDTLGNVLINWSNDELDELISLYNKSIANLDPRSELSRYDISMNDLNIFLPEEIITNFDDYFDLDPQGNYMLKPDQKKKMIKVIYTVANKLLARVSASPDADWRTNFSDFHEGAVQRTIRNTINNLSDDKVLIDMLGKSYGDFRDFLVSRVAQELDYEIDSREVYHEIRRYIISGAATPEDIAKYISRYPASRVNVILQGYNSSLVEEAVRLFEGDLKARIVMAGNKLPSDLFASYFVSGDKRYHSPDQERVKAILKNTVLNLAKDQDITSRADIGEDYQNIDTHTVEWEVERALTLARGISLLNTLRAHEYMATANPEESFRGQPGSAAWFNMKHKWRTGRGGEKLFKIPELFALDISQVHNEPFWKRVSRGWVPKVLYDKVKGTTEYSLKKVIDLLENTVPFKAGPEGSLQFRDILKDFSIYGFFSRGAWRFDAMKNWYLEKFNQSVDKDWRLTYQNLLTEVGAASRWFLDRARVESETRNYILENYDPNYKNNLNRETQDAIFISFYTGGESQKKFDFLDVNGSSVKMTTSEFIAEKELNYHSLNYQALLKRSPYDFLLDLTQLEPQLIETYDVAGRGILSSYSFYFEVDTTGFTPAQLKDREKFRERITTRWTADNLDHIGRIAQVWHEIYERHDVLDQNISSVKREERKIDAQRKMEERMRLATSKVVLKNKVEMTTDDIYTDPQDLDGVFFNSVFLGQNGLVGYFTGLNERFADQVGQERTLGDKKFFYVLAKRWFDIDMRVIPNTNEMKLYPIFANIKDVGEDVFKRLWKDVDTWNKVVDQLVNLDELLLTTASSGEKGMEKIFEIHAGIQSLQGMIGEEPANRLNYLLATTVIRFFQENYLARLPFGLNLLGGVGLRRFISLSVKHKGYNVMTWKEENIREYADKLWKMGALKEKGKWSKGMIEKAVGADLLKYGLLQAGPSIFSIASLIILITFLKKAFEEEGLGNENQRK